MKTILTSLIFICALSTHALSNNEITFHMVSPMGDYSWSSVAEFLQSVKKRKSKKSPTMPWGHAYLEISCEDTDQNRHSFFTGYSTKEGFKPMTKDILFGQGLGVFFRTIPGKEIRTNENHYSKNYNDRWRYIKFKINKETCGKFLSFYNEFKNAQRSMEYGFTATPRLERTGATCTSYASSFLEALELIDPSVVQSWTREIIIPLKNIKQSKKRITIKSLKNDKDNLHKKQNTLSPRIVDWRDYEGEESKTAKVLDPFLVKNWIQNQIDQTNTALEQVEYDSPNGIVLDKTQHQTSKDSYFVK